MSKNRIISLVVTGLFLLSFQSGHAQAGLASGLYQITSGTYIEIGGIGGSLDFPLPAASQSYIELTIDSQNNLAQMTFLAQDKHTVFRSFTNGVVLPDHIRWEDPVPPPPPGQPYLCYTASNSAGALRIDGVRITPLLGPDIPNQFVHTNVLALVMPIATIQFTEAGSVWVCWNTVSNCCYQVQYRSELNFTNGWHSTGFLQGNGEVICLLMDHWGTNGQPQQFYRIHAFPCP